VPVFAAASGSRPQTACATDRTSKLMCVAAIVLVAGAAVVCLWK
jgi:hypothetical protein